jgi:hypothetical protein
MPMTSPGTVLEPRSSACRAGGSRMEGHPVLLSTEVNRYEGALARTLGLSTFVLVQRDVLRRVVFAYNFGGYVGEFQPDAEVD